MVDAAVRPKTTRPRSTTADENLRIDVARVTDLLMGTWADTRREAREMIKDSAFWRDDSLGKDARNADLPDTSLTATETE